MSSFTLENKWRPFCSERCKMIDLGVWGSGGYRIADDKPATQPDLDDKSGSEQS